MTLLIMLSAYILPSLALVAPALMLAFHINRHKLRVVLSQKIVGKLLIWWFILSSAIFALMLYLSGSLGYFFYVEPGIYQFDGGIQFNINTHLAVTFLFNPGYSLLVVSILSGLIYAAMLSLPPVCVYTPEPIKTKGGDVMGSTSSSLTAGASAVASTAVCCTTSVAAFLAPALLTILGPFIPILLLGSMALLLRTYNNTVLSRFPRVNASQVL